MQIRRLNVSTLAEFLGGKPKTKLGLCSFQAGLLMTLFCGDSQVIHLSPPLPANVSVSCAPSILVDVALFGLIKVPPTVERQSAKSENVSSASSAKHGKKLSQPSVIVTVPAHHTNRRHLLIEIAECLKLCFYYTENCVNT